MTRRRRALRERRDAGSATVWLVMLVPMMWGFAALAHDGGRVIAARQQAANVAEQGARLAVDQLDVPGFRGTIDARAIDVPAASSVACGYVSAAVAGSSCSTSVADGQVHVEVSVTAATPLLAVVGVSSVRVGGQGSARPAIGAQEERL